MKYSVKFRLERRRNAINETNQVKIPIIADIRYAGSRLNYFTGFRIDEIGFDIASGRVKKNAVGFQGSQRTSYNIINGRLIDIEKGLKDLFDKSSEWPSTENIKSLLAELCQKSEKRIEEPQKDFFTAFSNYIISSNLSEGRKKHVQSALNHWKRFESYSKLNLSFDTISKNVLVMFEEYLSKRSKRPKGRNSRELITCPLSKNTIHSIMKMTRTFWNDSIRKGITTTYPFKDYEIPAEIYGSPIYLSLEERNLLYNAKIEDEKLDRIRDIFLFQCMVGARVGDLCRFTKGNINNGILSYIPRKTKDGKPITVTIPLSEKALNIIAKYNLPGDLLLPFISDQRYNDYLKELFKLDNIKLDRIVTRLNPLTREPEQVRICDIASSHLARRTFVGNLYGKIDSDIICSMSGHVQGSKAFSRYHDVTIELQQKAISLIA
jgi:integrase